MQVSTRFIVMPAALLSTLAAAVELRDDMTCADVAVRLVSDAMGLPPPIWLRVSVRCLDLATCSQAVSQDDQRRSQLQATLGTCYVRLKRAMGSTVRPVH